MKPSTRWLAVAAPIAALIYPAVLWCGVSISPVFVIVSVAVPLVGLAAVLRAETTRAISLAVVAVPPMFSLLGGWLDFQHVVPFGDLAVWIPLWSALAVAAAIAAIRGPRPRDPRPPSRRIAIAHGISALVIVAFACVHVINHLAGLAGGDAHIAVMTTLRRIYRHRLVEPILLAAVVFQISSGAWLLGRAPTERTAPTVRGLQTASATYLLVFLLSHVSAVLRMRARGGDSNWHWLTSDGELLHDPWSVRLVPYYALAVVALGAHLGCGLSTVLRGHRVAIRPELVIAISTVLATIVSALITIAILRA